MSNKASNFLKEVNAALKAEKKGQLMTLKSSGENRILSGLSSGSITLNNELSGNPSIGYARGRIVEIYGPAQAGKTTLVLHALAEANALGWPTVFIDAEHALDPDYAEKIGVNLNTMGFYQPECGEDALDIVETVIKKGCPLVAVDSVAALTPRAELDGEMGASHMGLHARLMSQAMRKLTGLVARSDAILIFINQIRMKIGVMFGNPETTTGGNALKFYSSYRLEVRSPRGGAKTEKNLTSDTVETGIMSNVKIVKNKVYPPFRRASIPIRYGVGIDKPADLAGYLEKTGKFIIPRGAKSKTPKIKIHSKYLSKNMLIKAMYDDPKLYTEVLKLC